MAGKKPAPHPEAIPGIGILETFFNVTDFPALELSVEELDDLIVQRGVGALYSKGFRCPCLRPETLQPRAGCDFCKGLGWAYPADQEEPVVAAIFNRQARKLTAQAQGDIASDSAVILLPSEFHAAEGDRIRPDGQLHTVQQLIRRQIQAIHPATVNQASSFVGEAYPVSPPVEDPLLYPDVEKRNIEAILYRVMIDGEWKLRQAGVGSWDLIRGRIFWRSGDGPVAGEIYTVRYRAPAVYVLFPFEEAARGEGGVFLPVRYEGKRLDRLSPPTAGGVP